MTLHAGSHSVYRPASLVTDTGGKLGLDVVDALAEHNLRPVEPYRLNFDAHLTFSRFKHWNLRHAEHVRAAQFVKKYRFRHTLILHPRP